MVSAKHPLGARLGDRAAAADRGNGVARNARDVVEDRTESRGDALHLLELVLAVTEELALVHAESFEGLPEPSMVPAR